ncbi:type 1 glutamine amidotransferase [Rhodococcus sp. 5A-K4]|uniref:type 1 glutamine amidotransferase n=1 Tax=Rhodococcus sp. 5A-K4 TaxID=3384442 RepID=UPI00136D6974|nr:type 1 glutamine amidotransferase [Rhodococcus erythropolis]
MSSSALAIVHGIDEIHRRDALGTLLPALQRRGFDVVIRCADDNASILPPPEEFTVIMVMGSHDSVYDESLEWIDRERHYLRTAIDSEVPIFGVCFGAQILACLAGGSVARSKHPEHGPTAVQTVDPDLVGEGPWLEFHHDTITVPDDVRVVARNNAGVQAFTYGPHLGVQFHPEASPEWMSAWSSSIPDLELYLTSHGVKLKEFASEIVMNASTAARDCDRLLDRFLTRAVVAHAKPLRDLRTADM